MRRLATAMLLLMTATSQPSAQAAEGRISSAFTDLPQDLDRCRRTPGSKAEDYKAWLCKGHGGIVVRVAFSGQRTHVSFGSKAAKEVAARETLATFNGPGKEIEWRIEHLPGGKSRPYAAISAWIVPSEGPFNGYVLVVTRLPPGGVCHVGYVDFRANDDAQELATRIADKNARAFKCGKDEPVVLGNWGEFKGPYKGGR